MKTLLSRQIILLFALISFGTYLAGQSESEPNNSIEEANPATFGTIEGRIDSVQDVDYFSFTITEPGVFIFNLDPPDVVKPKLALYDIDEETVLEDFFGTTGEDLYMDELVCNPGTYYLEVSRSNNPITTEPYFLTTDFITLDIYECNNDFENAKEINIGESIEAQFLDEEDVDYYKVNITEEGVLSFILNPPDDIRPVMELFAPGQEFPPIEEHTGVEGEDLYLDKIICTPGEYILKASSFWGNLSEGLYSLEVQFNNFDIYECNNESVDAKEINIGESIEAQFLDEEDVDYYKVNITEEGILTFILNPPDDIRPVMELFAPGQEFPPIEEHTGIEGEDLYLDKIICTPGEYILKASSFYAETSEEPYSLEIQFNTTDIYECNNEPEDAYLIAIGDTISAHFLDEEDQDYYLIQIEETGVYTFTVDPPNGIRPNLKIFPPGEESPSLGNVTSATGEDLIHEVEIVNPGIYTVEVTRFLGQPTAEFYRFSVNSSATNFVLKHYTPQYDLLHQVNSQQSISSPFKLCADGAEGSIFELEFEDNSIDGSDLLLRIAEDPEFNNVDYYGKFLNLLSFPGYITVSYKHPLYLNSINDLFLTRTLEVFNVQTGQVLANFPVNVYRAPVIMIHGLWSNSEAFDQLSDSLVSSNMYERNLLLAVDYEESNDHSFNYNHLEGVVKNVIEQLLKEVNLSNFAAGKVDIVTHSMGGILSRLYIQSIQYRNDVNKLITCNTPHHGSQLANLIFDPGFTCISQKACSLISPSLGSCYEGGVDALKVDGIPINLLNGNSSNEVFVHAITSTESIIGLTVPDLSEPTKSQMLSVFILYYLGLSDQNMTSLFDNNEHDLIVALPSQQGGLLPSFESINTSNQMHVGSVANSDIIQNLKVLLDENPKGDSFSQTGFMPPSEDFDYTPVNYCENEHVANLTINEPDMGAQVLVGENISFNISGTGDVEELIFSIEDGESDTVSIQRIDSPSANLIYSVSEAPLGRRNISVAGFDSTGRITCHANSYIMVETEEIPLSITARDTFITVGRNNTTKVFLKATFPSFAADISKVDDLEFIFSEDKASRVEKNIIRGDELGEDTLIIKYKGVESEPIRIHVFESVSDTTTSVQESEDYTESLKAGVSVKSIYPNPGKDIFTLEFFTRKNHSVLIEVFDLNGRMLLSEIFRARSGINHFDYQLSNISSGLFFLRLKDESTMQTLKFAKSR